MMWLCVIFGMHILTKMWSLFKRESKCKLCQIRCKYTQIVKYKYAFQIYSVFKPKYKYTQKSKCVFQTSLIVKLKNAFTK